MNRKTVEEKARQIASGTFSDGTMRTMLYERIVSAFVSTTERQVPRSPPRHLGCGGVIADGGSGGIDQCEMCGLLGSPLTRISA